MVIREQDPLKQGLKPDALLTNNPKNNIREQDPLKQGLKLLESLHVESNSIIREQDPLKQGLKLKNLSFSNPSYGNSRARSTKTRIETIYCQYSHGHYQVIREQDPLKQGLKH